MGGLFIWGTGGGREALDGEDRELEVGYDQVVLMARCWGYERKGGSGGGVGHFETAEREKGTGRGSRLAYTERGDRTGRCRCT